MTYRDFTATAQSLPPKDVPLEWIAPDGRRERGKYAGGVVWFPKGSEMYVYYIPPFWRLANGESFDKETKHEV